MDVLLQSYGDVQTLYTGMKQQGQVLVTFYDCNQAAQAYSFLNGRKILNRQLLVEFSQSQKEVAASMLPTMCSPILLLH